MVDVVSAAPRVISPELKLAHDFIATLADPRAPWAAAFESWADAHGLSDELRRATKISILKLRMFSAVERHAARRRA